MIIGTARSFTYINCCIAFSIQRQGPLFSPQVLSPSKPCWKERVLFESHVQALQQTNVTCRIGGGREFLRSDSLLTQTLWLRQVPRQHRQRFQSRCFRTGSQPTVYNGLTIIGNIHRNKPHCFTYLLMVCLPQLHSVDCQVNSV